MPRRLYRQERLDTILQHLSRTGYVSVGELSETLGVSTVTTRSDLDFLQRAGQLVRTHGGAIPISDDEDNTLSFSVRQRANVQEKERIGASAAELVGDGQAVVLDSSTTAWHIARCLLSRRDLTVLTTGLYVAIELLRAPGISVIVPGGSVWREAAAILGPINQDILDMGNWQMGFFGGRGLTLAEGLTDANKNEVSLKRRLAEAVRQVNVVVDASKLGKVAFAACAPIELITRVVTGRGADREIVAQLCDRGIEVILA